MEITFILHYAFRALYCERAGDTFHIHKEMGQHNRMSREKGTNKNSITWTEHKHIKNKQKYQS